MSPADTAHDAQLAPLVCVIVITFNGKRHLDACFSSLRRTEYANWRAMLVDNASADGSAEFVASAFPWVTVMRHETNLGFAAGNNRALDAALDAGAGYVVLLNDDTMILDPRWLHEAVALAEREAETGMIGFRLLDKVPEPLDSANRPDVCASDTQRIDGCALFMRSSLLRRIGLFDEVYFAYSEEDDLEARAIRAGARLRNLDIPVYHYGGGTSKNFPLRFSYLQIRNSIRYSIKNRKPSRTLARIVKIFFLTCSPFPLFLDPSDGSHARMRGMGNIFVRFALFLGAVIWNIIHLPATFRARSLDDARMRCT